MPRRKPVYGRYKRSRFTGGRSKGNFRKAPWGYAKGQRSWSNTVKTPFAKTVNGTVSADGPLIHRAFKPQRLTTNHRYCQQVTLTNEAITGLTGNEWAFRLGSLFDPDFTGVGHQPMGFDQMGALFTQYQVYRVQTQIKVTYVDRGVSGATVFAAMNVRPFVNNSYSLGPARRMDELQEQPTNTIIQLGIDRQGQTIDEKTFNADWYLADIEGLSRAEYMQDVSYKAQIGANPAKTPYLSVAMGSADEIAGATIKVIVSFVFHVIWSSPVLVGAS